MKVDIWSSGITLFAMLSGYLPFDEESKTKLYEKIARCEYRMPSGLSPCAVDLIKKILVVNPDKRITLEGIRNHPWLRRFNLRKGSIGIRGLPLEPTDTGLIKADHLLSKVTAKMMNIPSSAVIRMVQSNEHNKYITVYYLLKKKQERGDLDFKEYGIDEEAYNKKNQD